MGIQEEESEKEAESLFKEIIDENFPNLGNELGTQINETNRTPHHLNAERLSSRHILKLPKVSDKDRILKAARKKD